jgi:hypothetical protein
LVLEPFRAGDRIDRRLLTVGFVLSCGGFLLQAHAIFVPFAITCGHQDHSLWSCRQA